MYTKILVWALGIATTFDLPLVRKFVTRQLERIDKEIVEKALSNEEDNSHEDCNDLPYVDVGSDERSRLRQ